MRSKGAARHQYRQCERQNEVATKREGCRSEKKVETNRRTTWLTESLDRSELHCGECQSSPEEGDM